MVAWKTNLIRSRSGVFSLIEIIATIAVMAIVFSLAIPVYSIVRSRAFESRALSNLKQHSAVFLQYCSDSRDFWPYFTDPSGPATVVYANGARWGRIPSFFDATLTWPYFLGDRYYNGTYRGEMFVSRPALGTRVTSYFYARGMFSRPEFWNGRARSLDPRQLAGSTVSEVAFPSRKGLLIDTLDMFTGEWGPARQPAVFVDGHAVVARRSEWRFPEVLSSATQVESRGFVGGEPVLDTVDGVRGIDL